ncbi:STAS domain-containing protein [Georgenia satyanarayanai]|uniref:STAS domain-containing protein n=1 Tax=Georgenia satyanarayanai TaxID=860221 RepID=UPI0020401099|nr:STAS domain-containing protein [Georgenia satyanarayanai]MCM3660394.1 STAS domain-containing protein [Georgenia satyanarayanai]
MALDPHRLSRPSAPGLDVRPVSGPEDAAVRLAVVGEIDLSTVPLLDAALSPLIADGAAHVALDLSGVSFCDVSGLNRLLAARRTLNALGSELVLHGPCPSLQILLDVLDPALELAPPLTRRAGTVSPTYRDAGTDGGGRRINNA